MSTTRWLLLSLIVLAINDVLLLSWIDRGSDSSLGANQVSTGEDQGVQSSIQESGAFLSSNSLIVTQSDDVDTASQKVINQLVNTNAISEIAANDQEFIRAFSRAAKTEELTQVFLEVQMRTQKLYQEIETRYATMSPLELLAEYHSSDNLLEKQTALLRLVRIEFKGVEPFELKAMYEAPDIDQWAGAAIIRKLVSIGDSDGLRWAKQSLELNQGINAYIGTDMLSGIYQHDPDFVKEYINSIDLNNRDAISGLSSLLYQEQELAKEFIDKNFDAILLSDNNSVLQLSYQVAELDLDLDQQRALINTLVESNRNRRDFALRLLRSVKDTDLLREGYQSLDRDNDRIRFLSNLYNDQRELVRELAGNSDNPKIQGFAR